MVSKYIIIYKNAVNNICGGFVMSSLNPSKTYFRKKIYFYKFGLGIYTLWQVYYSYWFLKINTKIKNN